MIHFEIVSPEKTVYQERVDQVIAQTEMGEITILPDHAPLVSALVAGEMRIKKGSEEFSMSVAGGFLEVQPGSRVLVLADDALRAEEIDEKLAEEARKRAEQLLSQKAEREDIADIKSALAHALAQLKVVKKRRRV